MKRCYKRQSCFVLPVIGLILFVFSCKNDEPIKEVDLPKSVTIIVSDITASTVKSGGVIVSDGGDAISACGLCWGLKSKPTIEINKTTDTLINDAFTSRLKNLISDTIYYIRAYAVNKAGVGYGNEIRFRTLKKTLPKLVTKEAVDITSGACKVEAEITYNGDGVISTCGFCWDVNENPTLINNKNSNTPNGNAFGIVLDGLMPESIYYIRAYATNEIGTGYGNQIVLKTSPVAEFSPLNLVASYNSIIATSGIISDFGTDTTEKGFCWKTGTDPTINDNSYAVSGVIKNYSYNITNLEASTVYYVRAYARNKYGLKYSNSMAMRTLGSPSTITDASGNIYKCVVIGSQTWMAADLKTGKYRNGDIIPGYVNSTSIEGNVTTYYSNQNYGKFYNWYAVIDTRNIAPVGWHVATDADWTQLETFLGGSVVAGGKLKENADYWFQPNAATDEYGFRALPAGWRYLDGSYDTGFEMGHWWNATELSDTDAYYRTMYYRDTKIRKYSVDKRIGMAVRCVKD
jgi:uncharacterized protein (TIGR02145 family)